MVKEFVQIEERLMELKTSIGNGYRHVRIILPAVITVTRELNKPRALSFSGIIRSRKKEISLWGSKDINVRDKLVGIKGSPTIVTTLDPTVSKRDCKIITGTRGEKTDKLVSKLAEYGIL